MSLQRTLIADDPPAMVPASTARTALIVDDDEDMRSLVRATIELSGDVTVLSTEARGSEEALALWREDHHDVVVLDYRMPGRNGLDVAATMLAERPEQDVILFSAYLDDTTMATAERLGVRGCLSKDRIRDIPAMVRSLLSD